MEEKERMCEFYLHNIILPHPYKWNLSPYVRVVQMMAFMSWLIHEEMRAKELKTYKENEFQKPLRISAKSTRKRDVIPSHIKPLNKQRNGSNMNN
jgi:hypothetical protein